MHTIRVRCTAFFNFEFIFFNYCLRYQVSEAFITAMPGAVSIDSLASRMKGYQCNCSYPGISLVIQWLELIENEVLV